MNQTNSDLNSIRMQIMWNRLISVVEEQAQTLVRTAFSTSVREAGDLAAAAFDEEGRMLAQAVTGTPGHINAMELVDIRGRDFSHRDNAHNRCRVDHRIDAAKTVAHAFYDRLDVVRITHVSGIGEQALFPLLHPAASIPYTFDQ